MFRPNKCQMPMNIWPKINENIHTAHFRCSGVVREVRYNKFRELKRNAMILGFAETTNRRER